jgi:hypothetical protein
VRQNEDVPSLDAEIRVLLDLIDEAFDKKSWHGPNLRGAIHGVSPAEAAWRPAPGRHNIWEKRGSFVLKGSNFFERPVEQTEAAWKQDAALLVAEHKALRGAVTQLPRGARDGVKWRSMSHLIRGAAAHDLYHAGQIRLLRRLWTDAMR